jgi:hypothetical protein
MHYFPHPTVASFDKDYVTIAVTVAAREPLQQRKTNHEQLPGHFILGLRQPGLKHPFGVHLLI